jgi:hypothetical protein
MPLSFDLNPPPEFDALKRAMKRFDDALDINSDIVKRGVAQMAEPAERYASSITHQDTATLWRSYKIDKGAGTSGTFATVFVDSSVVNPRGQRPVDYAFYEFARGGAHDAFGRTLARSATFVNPGVDYILDEAAKKARV